MVIGKGSSYGNPTDIDPSWPVIDTDHSLATHIDSNGQAPAALVGGDLLTTLGGGAPSGVQTLAYPVDLLDVRLDGTHHVAVAHVVARDMLWSGEFLVAMNAAWVDGMYLGPRAHPNDGLVDVTSGSLPWQQRLLARRRARTGTHLPHPRLSVVRRAQTEHRLGRRVGVRLDGQQLPGRYRSIEITVRPDAGLVVA